MHINSTYLYEEQGVAAKSLSYVSLGQDFLWSPLSNQADYPTNCRYKRCSKVVDLGFCFTAGTWYVHQWQSLVCPAVPEPHSPLQVAIGYRLLQRHAVSSRKGRSKGTVCPGEGSRPIGWLLQGHNVSSSGQCLGWLLQRQCVSSMGVRPILSWEKFQGTGY